MLDRSYVEGIRLARTQTALNPPPSSFHNSQTLDESRNFRPTIPQPLHFVDRYECEDCVDILKPVEVWS